MEFIVRITFPEYAWVPTEDEVKEEIEDCMDCIVDVIEVS